MSAQVGVKRCQACGYLLLRSYARYHTCRPGDTYFPHAKEREQAKLRKQGRA